MNDQVSKGKFQLQMVETDTDSSVVVGRCDHILEVGDLLRHSAVIFDNQAAKSFKKMGYDDEALAKFRRELDRQKLTEAVEDIPNVNVEVIHAENKDDLLEQLRAHVEAAIAEHEDRDKRMREVAGKDFVLRRRRWWHTYLPPIAISMRHNDVLTQHEKGGKRIRRFRLVEVPETDPATP